LSFEYIVKVFVQHFWVDHIYTVGVVSGGQWGPLLPWIFIHGTDIDRGLIALFFSFFFCYVLKFWIVVAQISTF